MRGYPWGTPGEALRLRGPQDRFFIDFGPFLGPLLGPKLGPSSEPWGVLERLDTAQGGLCALWNPFFSDLNLGIDFWSIFGWFWTPLGVQNRSEIDQKSIPWFRSEKGMILSLFFNRLSNCFFVYWHKRVFKKHAKILCFCMFFEYPPFWHQHYILFKFYLKRM